MVNVGRTRSKRWRDIAALCAKEPQTVPMLAESLGVKDGALRGVVASMEADGLLERADSPHRGRALGLTRKGRKQLATHDDVGGVRGLITPDERLLFVLDEGRGPSPAGLTEIAADPHLRWCLRVDGPVRFVASFGHGDAVAVDRAAQVLQANGGRAVVGRSDQFFDGEAFARYAKRIDLKAPRALSS